MNGKLYGSSAQIGIARVRSHLAVLGAALGLAGAALLGVYGPGVASANGGPGHGPGPHHNHARTHAAGQTGGQQHRHPHRH